jgi:predicted lysophospholipase L1 biosynthesis ABC-type transport system permease subunit
VPADADTVSPGIVVNETLAARLFPGQAAIGRQITTLERTWTIVGVAGDARMGLRLTAETGPQLYVPADVMRQSWRYLLVRTAGDPYAVLPAVRAALRDIDPTIPLADLSSLDERVTRAMAPERFRGTLLGALGVAGLLLSLVGIYGIVAHAAGNRSREIGIRLALGETTARVTGRIVGGALVPSVLGTVVGIAAALAASRWLESFLYGVAPRDPVSAALVGGIFVAVTVLAAYIPARRAGTQDPAMTLRVS